MTYSEIFRCPRCRGKLSDETCTQCLTLYEQTLGILDLRWPRPDSTNRAENALLSKLIEQYPTATFQEMIAIRFQNSNLPSEIRMQYKDYSGSPLIRSQQMLNMFQERLAERFTVPKFDVVLDLGCGVGASSLLLSSRFAQVVGIDVDLISLILARKFLEEQGVVNVVLAQAYAQRLPLPDGVVDYVVAQNVLEHLFDVETALQELRRVLTRGGCFAADSRNRFDLVWLEPHVKLRWVGFWPRRWQAWYVWQLRGVKYDHTQLLSLPELKRNARRVFGGTVFVGFPLGAAYGRSTKWDTLIRLLERIPLLRSLGLFFFPSHLLVVQVQPGEIEP